MGTSSYVTMFDLLSSVQSHKGEMASCYSQQAPFNHTWVCVIKMTFGKPPGNLRMEATCQGSQPIESPNPPIPWPPTSGEEKGAGDGTSTSVLWFNQLCLCNGASIKIQKDKVLLRERDLYWWYPHARDTPVLMGTEALVLRTLPDLTLCTFHLAVHLYPL